MTPGSTASIFATHTPSFAGENEVERAYLKSLGTPKVVAQEEFERLQNQANRLHHLLQVMPAGVVVIDGKGIVKQANTLAKELLGEPLEGQIWRNIIQRSFDPRKDDGHEVSLHDGRKVKLSITPLVEEPGQLVVLTDLTETRQLQQRIGHMQRLSALGKTVASLVHQIRTPLSAAILYAANLGASNLREPDRTRFSGKLQSRLRELESQVNDMLLFAKSGEKQVVHPFSIHELCAEVMAGSDAMLKQQGARFELQCDDKNKNILGNKPAIAGAIVNLIHNALQIKPEAAHIILSIAHQNNNILLTVSDNGPGIAKDDMTKIFEPFYTTKSQGTGLGLAVVSSVAKAHGGKVSVKNNAMGGASFQMSFPQFSALAQVSGLKKAETLLREG